jgi:uncharacterized protein YcbK (DUF882 family)
VNVQLSEYFWSSEFKCKCQRWNCDALQLPEPTLVNLLDDLRNRVGRPILISSGIRCAYWNAKQGGKSESAHLEGKAVDMSAVTSREKYELLKAIYKETVFFTRLGIASTFIHVDVSTTLAQSVCWTY